MITDQTYVKLPPKLYDKIEKCVLDLLMELNIKQCPIDPFFIAKTKGYNLVKYTQLPEKCYIELIYKGLYDGFSYYNPKSNTFDIYYNDNVSIKRQRFTIAHELGHICLGHKEESDLANKCANEFAGYLLAPAPLILKNKINDEQELAKKFNLSDECASIRYNKYLNWKICNEFYKDYENDFVKYLSQ